MLIFVLQAPCQCTGWKLSRFVSFRFVSQISVSQWQQEVLQAGMTCTITGAVWGDVGVLGVYGVMGCSKYAGARDLANENFKKG